MTYDSSNSSVVPAEAGYQEPGQGRVPPGVSVIYVSVDEPRPRPQHRAARGRGPLSAAARALHRMADRVDDVRRSLERAADDGRR